MPRILPLLLGCALLVASAGCGGNEKAQPRPDLTAEQVLERAAAAAKALRSFHFKLTHQNGGTPIPLGLQLNSAEGDVIVPDRLAADIRASLSGVSVSTKAIAIGEKVWITNPFSRRWQSLPGASVKDIADPASLVSVIIPSVTQPKLAGTAEIGGAQTHHITGKIDSAKLRTALPVAEAGYVADVDLWIGLEDYLPRQARVAGRLSKNDPENIVRMIEFSRFDQPVNIQAPE
jgi:hypothetical protein